MAEIKGKLSDIPVMDDEDLFPVIEKFVSIIKRGSFSVLMLRDVVYWNFELSNLGFTNLLEKEELIKSCKKVIDSDSAAAVFYFKHEALHFPVLIKAAETALDELYEYAKQTYVETISEKLSEGIDLKQSDCGRVLANALNETWDKNGEYITHCDSSLIANAFLASSPESQEELRKFFIKMNSYSYSFMDKEVYLNWLSSIKRLLLENKECSHLTAMRKEWLIGDIDKLIEK